MNRQMVAQAEKKSFRPSVGGLLQRKCDRCHEKEKILQRSAVGSAPETVPPIVHEVLRSPGAPLDGETRGFFEPRFGHDFSNVLVYAQTTSDVMSPLNDIFVGAFHTCPLQTKLKMSRPGDMYEQEADRVAEMVTRVPDPQTQNPLDSRFQVDSPIQTKPLVAQITPLLKERLQSEDSEKPRQVQANPQIATPLTILQRQEEFNEYESEDEEDVLQAKSTRGDIVWAPSSLSLHIDSLGSSSRSLAENEHIFFNSRFGYDFKQVRIHSDAKSADIARSLHAQAFTIGQDIFFGQGRYSSSTLDGKKLLAHELTHVIQQHSGKANAAYKPILQRSPEKAAFGEQATIISEKSKPYPPVYWSIDYNARVVLAIPKAGITLEDVANFLYGNSSAKEEIAKVNNMKPTDSSVSGVPLRLTGKVLTRTAFADLNASPKIPLGASDPAAFMAKKQILDAELKRDFELIVKELDKSHTNEDAVIARLQRWGEEKFATNPKLYPNGGEYLDKLFLMLKRKSKDVGIITAQQTSYYNLIFNRFVFVKEVSSIRDRYSRNFKGDRGLKEMSFGSFMWEQVKNGQVRDQIFAYFKGLGKGFWAGAKGMATMAFNLVTDPTKFFSDIAKLPAGLKALWQNRSALWKKFANASPEKQAEMIGEVFGEIEFMIASGGAAKGIAKLAEAPSKIGKMAKVVQVVTKMPSKALGVAAKGVATGVGFAVRGAVFAAKGVYRIAGKVLRGTWSVVEKTVRQVKRRIYYFYDDVAKVLRRIQAKFAKKCVHCSSPCKLTPDAEISLSEKNILKEFAERAPAERAERQLEYAKKFTTRTQKSEKARHRGQFEDVEGRPRIAGHHGFPQYLGGRYRQKLLDLPEDLHYLYHQELDLIVKIPRKLGGKYYQKLSRQEMQDILKKVVDHAQNFDKRYGTNIKEALIKGIKEAQPLVGKI